jgi:hypothetical protein
MCCWLRLPGRRDALAHKFQKFFARQGEIFFRQYRFAEMHFNFSQAADGMKRSGFRGDQLHIFDEHRHDGQARFLRDEIDSRLAWADVDAIAARAFGKNEQMKIFSATAKFLQLADASGIQFPAFDEKTDFAAQDFFQPGSVPDIFVAQRQDGIAAGTPAQPAEQNCVEQADVVGDEQIFLRRLQTVQAVRPAQIREGEKKRRAKTQHGLDEFPTSRDSIIFLHDSRQSYFAFLVCCNKLSSSCVSFKNAGCSASAFSNDCAASSFRFNASNARPRNAAFW